MSCGIAAGVWLGAAEAPTKLVNIGLSPFAVSLWMVAGVFTARWTFPTLLKGTSYVVRDLGEKKHLIVWALLAGALWAVANTLTVFAIRDVGLAIAFPLWNANSLFGLLWGRVLFRELQGASRGGIAKWRWALLPSSQRPSCSDSVQCMVAAMLPRTPRVVSLRPSVPAPSGAPCMCPTARLTSAA